MKSEIFTPEGMKKLLFIRDNITSMISVSGAFTLSKAMAGDNWTTYACIDYLKELGEIIELTDPAKGFYGHRVFISGK